MGWSRRPWANPPALAGSFVKELVHRVAQGRYWRLRKRRDMIVEGHRRLERIEVLLLYRAGAIWLDPRSSMARLTPEALSHPDVVEMIWMGVR